MEVILCKEEAQNQVAAFGSKWGLYDAKAVISSGQESSIPEEVRELFLANVMTGHIEFKDDGATVVQNLSTPVGDLKKLTFKNKLKTHNMRQIQEAPEADQPLQIAMACTGETAGNLSELTSRDSAVLTAVTVYISFT